jgi:sugar phosphate isomerase/epimerase
MKNPHVHVPCSRIEDYLGFIKEHRINPELYFSSNLLDRITVSGIKTLKESLDYHPSFSIHAPFMDLSPGAVDEKIRAITIERFLSVFDIAQILRPKTIVFHSGYEKWKYARNIDLWLEGSLITWRAVLERARALNIRIAIENVFEDDPANLRILMERINSEHFGICFDTGHFNIFSTIPLGEWIGQLKPYLVELHLHDNHKTSDSHIAIGEGTFDFDALFAAVKDRDMIYTIEGHTPEDVIKSIARLNEYS